MSRKRTVRAVMSSLVAVCVTASVVLVLAGGSVTDLPGPAKRLDRRRMRTAEVVVERTELLTTGIAKPDVFEAGVLASAYRADARPPGFESVHVCGMRGLLDLIEPALREIPGVEVSYVGDDRDAADFVLSGSVDVAILRQPVSDNERGRGLVDQRIGWFAPVLAVPSRHPVHGVSAQAGLGLLSGRVRSWHEVGGDNLPVMLFGPSRSSMVELVRLQTTGARRLASDRAFASWELLETALRGGDPRTAVGVLPLTAIPHGLRTLAVGRLRPTEHLVRAGGWPWATPIMVAAYTESRDGMNELLEQIADEDVRRRLRYALLLENDEPAVFAPSPR